jgi:hypothetical protein
MKIDTPPNCLMDSIASPEVKSTEGKGVGVHSLAHNISRVEGVLELLDGIRKNHKWVNYSHRFAQTKQQIS